MKNKKSMWIVILSILLAVIVCCAAFLIYYFLKPDDTPVRDDTSSATKDEATVSSTADDTVETAATEPTASAFGYDLVEYPNAESISFEELMDINPDIYAWLYIPNTNVDYPVAQSISDGDDSFYLNHNVYRNYQFSGTIYSETQNSTLFDDPVTVLYGHNMLNGSMFATLLRFSDADFFEENNTAFVFTKDKLLTYLIYSAYVYDDRHILNSFHMNNEDSLKEYLDSTLEPRTYNGNVRDGVTLTADDKILTLSTCTNGAGNTRFLVQGVLVNERPR